MKKVGVMLFAIVLIASMFVFVSAVENETVNDTVVEEGLDGAFTCLDTALKTDCSGANTIEELSLAVLASSDNSDACLAKLIDKRKAENCWGDNSCTVKDTAMAIIALDHAGEDTNLAEEWLLTKNMTSSDLIWYLQQDSNEKTECKFSYDSNDYNIQIYENKKLSGSAGSCLPLAPASFWLQVSPNCYTKSFDVSCDKDFIATLLYQQRGSSTYYILSDTNSAPKFETITLSPKSFCFGDSTTCSYSATVWATLALLKTGHSVDDFVPYVIALEETNKPYLPKAFSYIITEENEYALQLIEQKGGLNDYWLADSSAHDKYYDTALAYLAISGVSSDVDSKARDWFEFSQNNQGCWESGSNSLIRDTGMVLWALEGRSFSGSAQVSPTTRCTEAGFWCMAEEDCVLGQISENYFCEGLTKDTCCTNSNLKDCSELEGEVCVYGEVCEGASQDSNQGSCCLGTCTEAPEETECEQAGGFCKTVCSSSQVETSDDCGDAEFICCEASTEQSGGLWWIWLLIVLILIVLGVLGWIYREKVKMWWFKLKTKFRKDKGGKSSSSGGLPPRPGFPPIRGQPMRRPMPQRPPVSAPARGQLDDVFKKLHEMSK